MSLQTQFLTAFSGSLVLLGEDVDFTRAGSPALAITAVVTSIGPEDAAYQDRVASRFTVELLATDLSSVPQKRDRFTRNTGEVLEVYEIRLEWGVYSLICELSGRPVPR